MKLLGDIAHFFEENRLYAIIIGTVISSFVTEVAFSIINNLIMPIFDFNFNNKSDITELKTVQFNILGKKIKIGNFLYSFIRFFIVLVIFVYIDKLRGKGKK